MADPTRDDVDLVLRLYEMRREATLRKARRFMIEQFYSESAEEFTAKYPPGSDENAYFRQALSYWDMVGVFVRRGLLNQDLLFETSGEFRILWEKARATVVDLRRVRNTPHFLKNLEELSVRHTEYMEQRSPGSSAFYASLNRRPAAKV
jgi:hypothetical protein